MTVNIEKMRADMAAQQKHLDWETRKFVVSLVVAFAVAAGGAAAVATYIARQQQPAQIVFQPGSIVAPPAPTSAPK